MIVVTRYSVPLVSFNLHVDAFTTGLSGGAIDLPLILAFKRSPTPIRRIAALHLSQNAVHLESMSKFLSFWRNTEPPFPDGQGQIDDNMSPSGLTDIKDINAHALDETSTLENEGGAAVEIITPLGRNLGWTSAFFINVLSTSTVKIPHV